MYPDEDYLREIRRLLTIFSYHIRKRKNLNPQFVQELTYLVIELYNVLISYMDDHNHF